MRTIVIAACAALAACGGNNGGGTGGGGGGSGGGSGGSGGSGGGGAGPYAHLLLATGAMGTVSITGTDTSITDTWTTDSSTVTVAFDPAGMGPFGSIVYDGTGYTFGFSVPVILTESGASGTHTNNGSTVAASAPGGTSHVYIDFNGVMWSPGTSDVTINVADATLVPIVLGQGTVYQPKPTVFTAHTADLTSGNFTLTASMPLSDDHSASGDTTHYDRVVDIQVMGQVMP